MSAVVESYYQDRAAVIGVAEVPEILNGEPIDLLPYKGGPAGLVAKQFDEELTPVEDFVLQGVPEVTVSYGQPLTQQEWLDVQQLPRYGRFISIAKYAARHLVPLAVQARDNGAEALLLQAVRRKGIPINALRRATSGRSYYARPEYEPTQAYFITSLVGPAGCTTERLTLLQGVHDVWAYHSSGFFSPRISGTPLAPDEADFIHTHNLATTPARQGVA